MKKSIAWTAVLTVIWILITWHVVHWHTTGTYSRLFEQADANKTYLLIYNIGIIAVLAAVLGLLMSNISDLISRRKPTSEQTENAGKADEGK